MKKAEKKITVLAIIAFIIVVGAIYICSSGLLDLQVSQDQKAGVRSIGPGLDPSPVVIPMIANDPMEAKMRAGHEEVIVEKAYDAVLKTSTKIDEEARTRALFYQPSDEKYVVVFPDKTTLDWGPGVIAEVILDVKSGEVIQVINAGF